MPPSTPSARQAAEPRAIRLGVWSGYLNLGVTWAIQLVMVPLLLRHLGDETYGLYAALTSVVGYFSLLTFGSSLAVPRFVADHAARGEAEALNRVVSTYFTFFAAVALAGLGVGLALAPRLTAVISVPPTLTGTVAPAWRLVVGGWALGLAAGLLSSLLTGLGEVHLANLASSGRTVLNLGFAAGILWSGGHLEALLEGLLAATAVSGLALYLLLRAAHPEIRISPRLATWATLRWSGRPAAYFFLMQLAALVVMGTDNLVIGAFLGVARVTPYAVAFQLYAMTTALLWAGVDVLLPFFARWGAQDRMESLRAAFLRATKYAFAGTALASVGIAAFGRTVIGWWVGPDRFVGHGVLSVFCVMLLIATPIHSASLVLAGLGRHRAPAIGGGIEAACNLALSLALVRPLGVLGVALGTLLAGAATNAWIAPRAACRELGIGLGIYGRKVLSPSVAPALAAGGVAWLLSRSSAPSLAGTATGVLFTVVVFAALYWTMGLDAAERRELRSLAAR